MDMTGVNGLSLLSAGTYRVLPTTSIRTAVSGLPTMPPQPAEKTAVEAGISPSDRPGKAVRNALGIVGFFLSSKYLFTCKLGIQGVIS
jgi:hypothetical protein